MSRKPAIERRAGQSITELALQLSGQEANHLTAPERKEDPNCPETTIVRAEAISGAISLHRKRLNHAQKTQRVNLDDTNAVVQAADTYLAACELSGSIPSMLAFCPCLGYSRKSVYQYLSRHDNETTRFLGMLQSTFASILSELSLKRQLSEPVSIFLLKNSGQGLTDKQELEVHPPEDPLETRDSAEIRRRYIAALPDDHFDGGVDI